MMPGNAERFQKMMQTKRSRSAKELGRYSRNVRRSHWLHNKSPREIEEIKNKIRVGQENKIHHKYSKSELRLCEVLTNIGIECIHQYPIKTERFFTRVDVYVPSKKLCVYIDGEYWHSLPGYRERDERANLTLKRLGYKVLRFPELKMRHKLDMVAEQISSYENI